MVNLPTFRRFEAGFYEKYGRKNVKISDFVYGCYLSSWHVLCLGMHIFGIMYSRVKNLLCIGRELPTQGIQSTQ